MKTQEAIVIVEEIIRTTEAGPTHQALEAAFTALLEKHQRTQQELYRSTNDREPHEA